MIVLDASAWIDVLTAGLEVDELADHDLLVPAHFDVEVVGAIRALVQHGAIGSADGDSALDRHLRGEFSRVYDARDARFAWSIRESMALADAWYVAIAHRLGAPWITADQQAGRTARRLGVDVTVV